jgi:hypothetical protein
MRFEDARVGPEKPVGGAIVPKMTRSSNFEFVMRNCRDATHVRSGKKRGFQCYAVTIAFGGTGNKRKAGLKLARRAEQHEPVTSGGDAKRW